MGRPACQGALRLPLSERACVAPLSAKARPLNLRSRLFAVGQDIKCIHGTAHRTSREDRSEGPIDRPCRSGPRKPTPEPRPACGPTYSARGTPELEHDSVTCTPYKSSKTARWSSGTLKLAVGLPSPRYSAPVLFKGRPRFPACPSFVNVALVPFRVLRVRLSVESHRMSRSACSSTVWCWYCVPSYRYPESEAILNGGLASHAGTPAGIRTLPGSRRTPIIGRPVRSGGVRAALAPAGSAHETQ